MGRTEICNRDCFHCQYEDCVLDELAPEDFNTSNELDRAATFDRKGDRAKREATYKKAYYKANREKEGRK